MKTNEARTYFNLTTWQLREIRKVLGIKGVGVGKVHVYSNLDIARIKAGVKYKDYFWIVDIDRFWIYYGFSPNYDNEIKIEI